MLYWSLGPITLPNVTVEVNLRTPLEFWLPVSLMGGSHCSWLLTIDK